MLDTLFKLIQTIVVDKLKEAFITAASPVQHAFLPKKGCHTAIKE